MKTSWLVDIVRDFVALFYPRYCLGCSNTLVKGEEMVCTGCMLELPQTYQHLEPENSLKRRLSLRIPLKYAMAFFKFSKGGRIQHLLHSLKYKNEPDIGVILGRVLGRKLKDANYQSAFDLIIPVPLHPSRKRKRGYNQSAKFAEGLSDQLNIPFSDNILIRKVSTLTQTRKTKLARWENVNEIFEVKQPTRVLEKRILLVDDVVTTGATVEACCQVLIEMGCKEISIACIAEA